MRVLYDLKKQLFTYKCKHLKSNIMKRYVLFLLIMNSVSGLVFSQFPSPTNFHFSYDYIELDKDGFCNGHLKSGPFYCSYFGWSAPDTTLTNSILSGYNIYYNPYNYGSLQLVSSTNNCYYTCENGFIGQLWITAKYSNPDGESGPSNIEMNSALPVEVKEIKDNLLKYSYNSSLKEIYIMSTIELKSLKIIDVSGRILINANQGNKIISVSDFNTGIYFLLVEDINNKTSQYKISVY